MANDLHNKHRERVRKEFMTDGFSENSSEHKLLEMLLYFAIPRKDTNEIAHLLINRFGTLSGVLEAPAKELMKIDGVGENTAMLLKLMIPVAKKYIASKTQKVNVFDNMDSICSFLTEKYIGFDVETFAVTTFNSRGAVVGFDILAQGDCVTVNVSVRNILEIILRNKAVCAVISHNHPGGTAMPSSADIETTKQIAETLKNIDVRLLDHIILCDDDYVSLAQSAKYKYIFNA